MKGSQREKKRKTKKFPHNQKKVHVNDEESHRRKKKQKISQRQNKASNMKKKPNIIYAHKRTPTNKTMFRGRLNMKKIK